MVVELLERAGKLVADQSGTAGTPGKKVVLLTGASGPIGTAFCQRYGADYDVVAVRHRRTLKVDTQLQRYFDPFDGCPDGAAEAGVAFEVRADLLQKSDLDRVVEVALARFGRIDVVLNAVGARDQARGILGAALRRAPDLYQLNALVPMNVAAAVAQQFWRIHDRDNARYNRVVVNLSAAASVDSSETTTGPAYVASKAALNVLSLHLSEELRPFNVRVATVAPATVPQVVTIERVVDALAATIEGDSNGGLLLMWGDGDELV